jgi:hypothetical protein
MKYTATPNDSRYIPFTQQRLCCVPTAISMIMYRQGIPLIPIEELGYHLGLVVPPEDKRLFYNARVSEEPPMVGYGTQVQEFKYDPNNVFAELNIPLSYRRIKPSTIIDEEDLSRRLQNIVDEDQDAILCFDFNTLHGKKSDRNCGHVVVFDKIINNKIRFIDPERNQPKWQTYPPKVILSSLKNHENFSGGVWIFSRKNINSVPNRHD